MFVLMEHRIRAAAIIVKDNTILLVKHKHPLNGTVWWVPPGGGLSQKETIYDCAARETWEEAGLKVILGKILYLREFIDLERNCHQFEVFILAESFSGAPTIKNLVPTDLDAKYIKEARFLSKNDLAALTVYPEIIKGDFWNDYIAGNLSTRYLGQQTG
jgi:8-oxo-dGTP pyrophosphatase MutT (NUDIX family)